MTTAVSDVKCTRINKTKTIQIRCTEEEKRMIGALSEQTGKSISALVMQHFYSLEGKLEDYKMFKE